MDLFSHCTSVLVGYDQDLIQLVIYSTKSWENPSLLTKIGFPFNGCFAAVMVVKLNDSGTDKQDSRKK